MKKKLKIVICCTNWNITTCFLYNYTNSNIVMQSNQAKTMDGMIELNHDFEEKIARSS